MGRMFLVGIESERLKRHQVYLCSQKSSKICTGIRPDSYINATISVLD